MRGLVVVGSCIKENSSANLCHCAYIKGLIELGHEIDLLTIDEKDGNLDSGIEFPNVKNIYKYYGVSLYEKLAYKKKKIQKLDEFNHTKNEIKCNNSTNLKVKIASKAKQIIRDFYGVYGMKIVWMKNAKNFHSNINYDYVISLSDPAVSHLLVNKLKNKKNIYFKSWIQIWEDPWSSDICYENGIKKYVKEEEKLLRFAEKVVYVSPLTLKYQKEMFNRYKDKMTWIPLPYYYKDDEVKENKEKKNNIYGYFGDYTPSIRNLSYFYEAAKESGIHVNICGNPSNLFNCTDKINIYPRLPLQKLHIIEHETDVLVFLCNLNGGQIPGKIYQYSATNKIIIFILDGTQEEKKVLKDYFKQFKRYLFCDNTKESILETINKIESGNISEIDNRIVEDFSPKNIASQIINLCKV